MRNPRLFDTSVGEKSPPRLLEGSEPLRLVVTEAMTQVSVTAQNVHSGSLGVSGPRGVGKSTILQFFGAKPAADEDSDLRLVVPAPVDYEPKEFIVHLSVSCARPFRTARPTTRRSRRKPAITWSSSGTCEPTRRAGRRR